MCVDVSMNADFNQNIKFSFWIEMEVSLKRRTKALPFSSDRLSDSCFSLSMVAWSFSFAGSSLAYGVGWVREWLVGWFLHEEDEKETYGEEVVLKHLPAMVFLQFKDATWRVEGLPQGVYPVKPVNIYQTR